MTGKKMTALQDGQATEISQKGLLHMNYNVINEKLQDLYRRVDETAAELGEIRKEISEIVAETEQAKTPPSKRWEPKEGERFYYMDLVGGANTAIFRNRAGDISFIRAGNCFKTKAEAEVAAKIMTSDAETLRRLS